MTGTRFALLPFPAPQIIPEISIQGVVRRTAGNLFLSVDLSGDISEIVFPERGSPEERRDKLWEETCFEFFLSPHRNRQYWEFNLSPSGHWNVYRFDEYRKGMAPEPAFSRLPFLFTRTSEALSLAMDLQISGLFPTETPVDVGITAVINFRKPGIAYYALAHKTPEPDFHQRSTFLISL